MRGVGKLTLVILVIVVAGLVVSVSAQKGGKPAPPPPPPEPQPLLLADGLNIITREIVADDRIRVWYSTDGEPAFDHGWEEYDKVVPYLALGDVDGDGLNELIMPVQYSVGTNRKPLYCIGLWAYKQGQTGPYYKTPCTGDDFVSETQVSGVQVSVVPFNLDGDRFDEVVLGTVSHVAVYKLVSGSFDKQAEADLGTLGLTFESKGFQRRSLAVGDLDGDGAPEIVTGGVVYTANAAGEEHSYLLVFNPGLLLLGSHHITASSDLPSFVINNEHGLAVGDTTGSGIEIWAAGWTNTSNLYSYDQHVRSWKVEGYTDQKQLIVTPGPGLDFPGQSRLGPKITVGKLDPLGNDQVVLNARGESNVVEVYSNAGGSLSNPISVSTPTGVSVNRTFLVDGKLFIGGTLASSSKTSPYGVYLGVFNGLDLSGPEWSNADRTGYQMWTFTVGHGLK